MAENNYDWNTVPEKFEELRKQNAGYWSGDAMPTINLWHFYHQDDDGKGGTSRLSPKTILPVSPPRLGKILSARAKARSPTVGGTFCMFNMAT